MSVNRGNVERAVTRRGEWSGERVGFSATPLGREGLLVDTVNGADLKGR